MKIIDLLNKIANGEEVPNEFIYNGCLYENYQNGCYRHYDTENKLINNFVRQLCDDFCNLNDEVEIKAEKKEDKPITKESIEALGYACGEIKKLFESGWNKSIENKPLEEENKIPEKLKIEQDGQTYNNFYIVNQNGTKCYLTKHSKMIVETLNQVIDYLKSKGE